MFEDNVERAGPRGTSKLDLLRGKRLDEMDEDVKKYISSTTADIEILPDVLKVIQAHLVMLVKTGIISSKEGSDCLKALESLSTSGMQLDDSLEDIHGNIEAKVIEIAGRSGEILNVAKSRNDQVATSIRMACRRNLLKTLVLLSEFEKSILVVSKMHSTTVMPGFTHLQHAQPVTLGHHLSAHLDAFFRDSQRLLDCYRCTNACPMGAAALASTSFQIDRNLVSKLLGFDELVENSIDAVGSRDFGLQILAVLSILMSNMSRLAEELVLWSTSEFSFVSIPDSFSSPSSIMPNKKNPVVAEIARAKTSKVFGNLLSGLSLVKALPLSYNLDLQELTPLLWDSFYTVQRTLLILSRMTAKIQFDSSTIESKALNSSFLTATDLTDFLVSRYKIPFRESHHIVGLLVRRLAKDGRSLSSVEGKEIEEATKEVTGRDIFSKVDSEELRSVLSPLQSVYRKRVIGSPNPDIVRKFLENRKQKLELIREEIETLEAKLKNSYESLQAEIVSIMTSSTQTTENPLRGGETIAF
jgi:argininosuccinate lyase